MYDEAANKGKSFSGWAEDHIVEQGNEPTIYKGLSNFEIFALKRQLKAAGETVPLTAYELLLQQEGIRAFGEHTDFVSKFFESAGATVLLPEFIANRVYAGALLSSIVPQFVAATQVINALDFRKLYLEDTEPDRQLGKSGRGGEFRRIQIKVGKQNVALKKYGAILDFDYEVVSMAPINLYSVVLQRIGTQIGIDESDDMIYAWINGDGNSNGLEAGQTVETTTSGAITKLDIINLASALPQPYKLTKFVGKKTYMRLFWDALSDMQNPAAQWGQTGMTLPLGIEWDRSVVTADRLIGVDPNLACTYITNDAMTLQETDRIIAKQQIETVISKRSAFDIIDQDAIGCLDVVH